MVANLLKTLIQLTSLLNSGADLYEALKFIYKSYDNILPYNMIGIVLVNPSGDTYSQICISDSGKDCRCICKGNELCRANCPGVLEKHVADELIIYKKVRVVENYEEYLRRNENSEHTKMLLEDKKAYDIFDSMKLIVNKKGTSFDPIVVDALINGMKEIINVHEQYNNDG